MGVVSLCAGFIGPECYLWRNTYASSGVISVGKEAWCKWEERLLAISQPCSGLLRSFFLTEPACLHWTRLLSLHSVITWLRSMCCFIQETFPETVSTILLLVLRLPSNTNLNLYLSFYLFEGWNVYSKILLKRKYDFGGNGNNLTSASGQSKEGLEPLVYSMHFIDMTPLEYYSTYIKVTINICRRVDGKQNIENTQVDM